MIRSPRPRLRQWLATVGKLLLALVVVSLAGCGGGGGGGGGVAKLGCHQYCQQAGGYGGGPAGRPVLKVLTTGTVVPQSDGTVPITVRCLVPVKCQGALLLESGSSKPSLEFACQNSSRGQRSAWWAQSDLLVDGNSARTIGLPLKACPLALLRREGRLAAAITADAIKFVPPCIQIPSLAAGCRKFVASPGYTPDEGDGLDRLIGAGITLRSR